MHRSWAGWRRWVFGRCKPDQSGCGQEEAGCGQPADCLAETEETSRAVREYLAALDAARSDEDNGELDGGGSMSGGAQGTPPKQVSLTDPQAAWVTRKGIDPFFAYDANYLIDNKAGIILDAEGTRANRRHHRDHAGARHAPSSAANTLRGNIEPLRGFRQGPKEFWLCRRREFGDRIPLDREP